jgi:UDP-glucuronate 4-epimerase
MAAIERFLVTGCMGCIGSWAVRLLLDEGVPVVGFDLSTEPRRLRLIASEDQIAQAKFVTGDITDTAAVKRVIADEGITHIVHLAALQAPFCAADPVRGAQVNVVGTVNIFEAAVAHRDQVRGISYASSAAVFGPPALYPNGVVKDDSPLAPSTTIYGVYKQANEWTAKVYAQNQALGSVGLRPFVVYGPGRDQGMTSTPTVAMVAAVAGRPYRISFGGYVAFQYAEDVARLFIRAARTETTEAVALNIGGHCVSVAEIVAAIEAVVPEAKGLISYEEVELPFPARVDSSGLERFLGTLQQTPLLEGIRRSIETFRQALARNLLEVPTTSGERVVGGAAPD